MSKQVILEVSDAMAREIEMVAPSRKRLRSEFFRSALRKALDEAGEARMREAYLRQPDAAEPYALDAEAWEAKTMKSQRRRRPA